MITNKDGILKILQLIDLTSLNSNDSFDTIKLICNKSVTKFGNVAAICIYSHFIEYARKIYQDLQQNMKIATVVNFPHAMTDIDLINYEVSLAINRGADEIDLVFPYHALINGDIKVGVKIITNVRQLCKNNTLKVIIESGELKTTDLIYQASKIAINAGADFIKTSTGKVAVNATVDAVKVMLEAIKDNNRKCGIKIAGGVRTLEEAIVYYNLAENFMGESWVNLNTFRFGTSSLLDNLLNYLNNKQQIIDINKY
jgi:deoxyribose-phosphate aldolase